MLTRCHVEDDWTVICEIERFRNPDFQKFNWTGRKSWYDAERRHGTEMQMDAWVWRSVGVSEYSVSASCAQTMLENCCFCQSKRAQVLSRPKREPSVSDYPECRVGLGTVSRAHRLQPSRLQIAGAQVETSTPVKQYCNGHTSRISKVVSSSSRTSHAPNPSKVLELLKGRISDFDFFCFFWLCN